MTSRILSSIAAASICLTMAGPAFAETRTTDDVLTELASFDANTICADRTGRNLGRCIGDVIKRISILKNEFTQAARAERAAWYAEHGQLGVSGEYRDALNAYLADTKTKRERFTQLQRDLEKTFFAARKELLENATTEQASYTRAITGEDMDAAKAKCAKQSDASGLRICMRQQLRLINPLTTRRLNIPLSGR